MIVIISIEFRLTGPQGPKGEDGFYYPDLRGDKGEPGPPGEQG